ncbi:hypothetical protein PtA15_5A784 [Puccinia triticina]|uniref:Uncharacterized protein n=1 Tax=Puccinia triticina TaxID=208348 RepID=A0ABY7CJG2_9BASI|nr:uncharacterized protein PtA15_5A784 [Puccinia triticina]WAQ85210.1 hypothetical protein PtA15_5A784 [Puccinia triticina]
MTLGWWPTEENDPRVLANRGNCIHMYIHISQTHGLAGPIKPLSTEATTKSSLFSTLAPPPTINGSENGSSPANHHPLKPILPPVRTSQLWMLSVLRASGISPPQYSSIAKYGSVGRLPVTVVHNRTKQAQPTKQRHTRLRPLEMQII